MAPTDRFPRQPGAGVDYVAASGDPDDQFRLWKEGESFPRAVFDGTTGLFRVGDGTIAPALAPGALPHGGRYAQAVVVGAPGCSFTGVSISAALNGVIFYEPFTVESAVTVDQLLAEITTLEAASTIRMGIYAVGVADGLATGAPLADSGNVASATTGVKTATLGTPVTLQPGFYCTALQASGAVLRARQFTYVNRENGLVNTLGATPVISLGFATFAYAAFPTNPPAPTGFSVAAGSMIRSVLMHYSTVTP